MNKNGSVLTITLIFVLVFMLMGLAIIRHAGFQATAAENRQASLESFWLADGAVQMAWGRLKQSFLLVPKSEAAVTTGRGAYDVFSEADSCPPTCAVEDMVGGVCPCVSWRIKSYGEISGYPRAIYAKAGNDFGDYNIENAIETHGTVNDLPKAAYTAHCSKTDKDPEIYGGCVEYSDFSFENVFNMTTAEKDAFLDDPDYYYDDPSNAGDITIINKLTRVDLAGNNCSLSINSATQVPKTDPDTGLPLVDEDGNFIAQGSFLYVDGSDCSTVSVGINGDVVFRGIVWIVGEGAILGTASIYGAVFIDGALDGSNDTDAAGDSAIYYDPDAIKEAIDGSGVDPTGGGGSGTLSLIAWREEFISSDKSEFE